MVGVVISYILIDIALGIVFLMGVLTFLMEILKKESSIFSKTRRLVGLFAFCFPSYYFLSIIWLSVRRGIALNEHFLEVLGMGLLLSFMYFISLCISFWIGGVNFKEVSYSHGSARFLIKDEELRVLDVKNNGLVIDGYRRIDQALSFQNCLVVAPTGVGKTQSFVLPNILSPQGYSLVVTDPSGEIYDKTSSYLKDNGYNVVLIQPYNPRNTNFYNPLHKIKTISEAKIVSKTILKQVESKGDPIWHTSASALLASYILILSDISEKNKEGKNYRNFINIKWLLTRPDEDIKKIVNQSGSSTTKEEVEQVFSGSEKVLEGVKSTLISAIELFSDENYRHLTLSHDVNFEDLRKKRTVLYLVIPEEKIKISSAFLSLFYRQLFEFLLSHSEENPVFTILEEFANTGYIPDFDQIITVSRKKKVSISIVIQEIEQISKLYKGSLETIISGGCQNKLFYSGLGLKTSQYVSSLLGDSTIEVESESNSRGGLFSESTHTVTKSKIGRRLLSADEVRRLSKDSAIFVTGNQHPIIMPIVPIYKDKKLSKLLDDKYKTPRMVVSENREDTLLMSEVITEFRYV